MRIQILHDIYWNLHGMFWRFYARLSPRKATVSWYKMRMKKDLNLDNPKALTEKLQYLKLNDYFYNPLVTQCADKYKVREYVEKCGCKEILNELYCVYDSIEDINLEKLPQQFVLKCNHGCGGNILCYDKEKIDIREAKKKLQKWLKSSYGLDHVEFSYENIPPKIVCEKLIQSEDGYPPRDYKIFCSYGEPKLIYTISERKENTECLDYFTPDWEWIPVRNGILPNASCKPRKPEKLAEMLDYARKLSKNFPIIRVDLYCEFGKILFGELTFLPTGGCFKLTPSEYDYSFGEMFPLINRKSELK